MSFYIEKVLESSTNDKFQKLVERLKREREINQAIADSDPLDVDVAIRELSTRNAKGDVSGIKDELERAITHISDLVKGDFVYASAAIRDLCMFAASLIRFGKEPANEVRGFSDALMELSTTVKTKIPRDSFIDYTSRNPDGDRERRFTVQPEEEIFIDSLRQGMGALDDCLENLILAYNHSLDDSDFADYCYAAASHFQIMIDSIVKVKKKITPEVFTHYIRPFFEPFHIDGRAYSAPSGAEMSILNIDLIIWGLECKDELYSTYVQANIIRLPTIYQEICQQFEGQQSLMTRINTLLTTGTPLSANEYHSIRALHHLLTKIYSFRMPHYKVAEDNVKLRLKETGGGEVKGSGGFGIDEVKYVLDQTIRCRQILAQALSGASIDK